MKNFNLIVIFILCLLSTCTFAQTNLLDLTGDKKNIWPYQLAESGRNIYYIAYASKILPGGGNPHNLTSFSLRLCKVNKYSPAIKTEKQLCGDTTQADSLIAQLSSDPIIANGRIHLFYTKMLHNSAAAISSPQEYGWGIYYQQLDTNLNTIVPESRIAFNNGTGSEYQYNINYSRLINSKILLTYDVIDSAWNVVNQYTDARYMVIDLNGQVLRTDTIPPKLQTYPVIRHSGQPYQMPNGHVLFTGGTLLATGSSPMSMVETDASFNLIDTFNQKPSFYNGPGISGGFFYGNLELAILSADSWIGGKEFIYSGTSTSPGGAYCALVKLRRSTRFTADSLKIFTGKDTTDYAHTDYFGAHQLVYNKTDNRIYYANNTHSNSFNDCSGNSNYLQIISVDTNLQHPWRKFISSGTGFCLHKTDITGCDGRAGVLISGNRLLISNPNDTAQGSQFIYQVDSSTTTAVNDPTAPITIRNRIATYPNPATEYLTVDDILGHLASITLTNTQGQLIYQKSISGNKAVIPVKDYPPGLYLLRVKTTDGEQYSEKIVVR